MSARVRGVDSRVVARYSFRLFTSPTHGSFCLLAHCVSVNPFGYPFRIPSISLLYCYLPLPILTHGMPHGSSKVS